MFDNKFHIVDLGIITTDNPKLSLKETSNGNQLVRRKITSKSNLIGIQKLVVWNYKLKFLKENLTDISHTFLQEITNWYVLPRFYGELSKPTSAFN